MDTDLDLEWLRERLRYDLETGKFSWKIKPRNKVIEGAAGSKSGRYIYIGINQKQYLAHRLAWLFHYGRWPLKHIDHINGNCRDNRICNLREATRSDNLCNKKVRCDSELGLKGVMRKRNKFYAQIRKGNTRLNLGSFETKEQAHEAYKTAARKLHGEFAGGI